MITGAGSGIGRELTFQMLKMGAEVVAIDINEDSLNETKKLSGNPDHVSIYKVDITNKSDVEKLLADITKIHKTIDGIINNAGVIQPFTIINDLDYKTIDRVMNINFYGTVYITKTFLPMLLKRPEGHIVNISSMGGFLPVPGQSVYGASKAAAKLFTEGLYAELKDTNINVTVVFPGGTDTNIAKNSEVATPEQAKNQKYQVQSAQTAAKTIIRGIQKNSFQVFAGKDSVFMNILYRLSPKFATNYIAKQMKSLLSK